MAVQPNQSDPTARLGEGRSHGVIMAGPGEAPACRCGWVNRLRTGPILADHLSAVALYGED